MPLGLEQEQEGIKTVADTEGKSKWDTDFGPGNNQSNNENKSRNMCSLARIGEGGKPNKQFLLFCFCLSFFLENNSFFF